MRIFSNIKWLLHICIISMVCVFIGACATGRQEMVIRQEPNFDYMPNETVAGNTGVTFAVVGSQLNQSRGGFVPTGPSLNVTGLPRIPLFHRFIKNMAADFSEIVTARGYTVRGPFQTFDEMTFVDKDNSNLILTANIDFNFDPSAIQVYPGKSILGGGVYWSYSGSIVMHPRITLVIHEGLTNEKMWTKSVNITPINIPLKSSKWGSPNITLQRYLEVEGHDQIYMELANRLESMYQEVMNRTYGYLDPREMALLSKQAMELKKRKTF